MGALACILFVGMLALTWAAHTAGNAAKEAQDKLAVETAERQRLEIRNEALAEQAREKTERLVLIRRQLVMANERIRELEEGAKTHESES